MSKNSTMLAWFTEYCRKHPDQDFFQTIRSFTGENFRTKKIARLKTRDGFTKEMEIFEEKPIIKLPKWEKCSVKISELLTPSKIIEFRIVDRENITYLDYEEI